MPDSGVIERVNASLDNTIVEYISDGEPIEIAQTTEYRIVGYMSRYDVGQGYKAYTLRLEIMFREPIRLRPHLGVLHMTPMYEMYFTAPIHPDKKRPQTFFSFTRGLGPKLRLEIIG